MSDLIAIKPFMYLLTPLGAAEAHFLALTSFETPANWGCFQCETKENWWWTNQQVRLCESISAGRPSVHSPIFVSDALFEDLLPHILRHKCSPLYERAQSVAKKP